MTTPLQFLGHPQPKPDVSITFKKTIYVQMTYEVEIDLDYDEFVKTHMEKQATAEHGCVESDEDYKKRCELAWSRLLNHQKSSVGDVINIYEEDHQDYPVSLDGAEAGYEVTPDDISDAIELIIPPGQEWCEEHDPK